MNATFVFTGHSSPVSASSSSRLTSSSTGTLIQHHSSHRNVCRVHSLSSMPRSASQFSASKSSFSYSSHKRLKSSPSPSASCIESQNTIHCSTTVAQASTSEGFLFSVVRQIVSLAMVCFIQTFASKSSARFAPAVLKPSVPGADNNPTLTDS